MAFLGLGTPKRTSVTLVDIDSSSIGVAVMHFTEGNVPTICYSSRTEIQYRSSEDAAIGMARILQNKMGELIEKASPIVRQETGSGHIDHILVRIGSPWQKTLIRRERIEEQKPFIFTHALQKDILRQKGEFPDGFKSLDESVVATLLNGYGTNKPFDKEARQAEVVIASSWIDEQVSPEIQKIIRNAYHTHALTTVTPALVTYNVFKTLFPHEKNYLTIEMRGESMEMLCIKSGILVKVSSCSLDEYEVEKIFRDFATEHALPRTIFFIASDDAQERVAKHLDGSTLRSLWLSHEPLRIIRINQSQLVPFITIGIEAQQDTELGLFALFAKSAIHIPLPKG